MRTSLTPEKTAVVYALLAVLFWSTVATAFKFALAGLTPRWMLLIAVAVSWGFLSLVLLFKKQLVLAAQELRSNWPVALRRALINPVCYYLILLQAYDLLPAQQAQAINYTWAITMSLLAVPLLGQKLRWPDAVALLLAYCGVLVIATRGDVLGLTFDSLSGVLLALLSTLLWALYWILNTRDSRQGDQADAGRTLWSGFTLAVPLLLVITLLVNDVPQWANAQTQQSVAAAVYVGIFEMGLTFLLWQQAMNLTQRTAAISSLIFLSPFLSLVFISQLLGEEVALSTPLGLALILAGLALQKIPVAGRKAG
ncbi:MAG: EamA family transporter [Oceanospirillaceae bacterium]|nr:EamA family transporter [Oceanospirillaceae bacterium]